MAPAEMFGTAAILFASAAVAVAVALRWLSLPAC